MMMKKQMFLLMAVLSMFLFTACSPSPTSVAKDFSEAIAKGKYDDAKKYCTEPTGKLLDMASAFGGGTEVKPDFKFESIREEIDGETAKVFVKKGEDGEEAIDLVKVDGDWKVNMSPKK